MQATSASKRHARLTPKQTNSEVISTSRPPQKIAKHDTAEKTKADNDKTTDNNDDTIVTAIAVEETPTNTLIQGLLKQMQEMRAELRTVKGELTSVKQQLEQEREKNAKKKPYDPFSGSNSVNPSHKPSTATNSSSSSSARNATDKPSHAQGQWKTPLEIPPGSNFEDDFPQRKYEKPEEISQQNESLDTAIITCIP
eukprot:g72628.t1